MCIVHRACCRGGHTKCNLTEKSSPLPSILIFMKSKKELATFPINFFRGIKKVWGGGGVFPPPAPDRVRFHVIVHYQVLNLP